MRRSTQLPPRARGIALIQGLLLSLVLAALFVSVTYSAKSDLQDAQKIQQRSQAFLKLQTMEAETLFALLTHERVRQPDAVLPLPRQWNFWNSPMQTAAGTVQIYDVNGYFSAGNASQLRYLLQLAQMGAEQTEQIVQQVQQLSRPNALLPPQMLQYVDLATTPERSQTVLQLVDELRFVPGVDEALYRQLAPALTSYPVTAANPSVMPAALMALYVKEPMLSTVLALRESHQLTPERFMSMTGLNTDDGFNAYPSNALQLRFTAYANDVKLSRDFIVILTPREPEPISFWEYNKYSHVN